MGQGNRAVCKDKGRDFRVFADACSGLGKCSADEGLKAALARRSSQLAVRHASAIYG